MNSTASVFTETSKNTADKRTSPVYVQEKGKLSLNDIISPKPADFNGQIDISWLASALNQKACEIKYAPWDALHIPKGLWVSSAYGDNTIIAASADGKICVSHDNGASWHETKISPSLKMITYGKGLFLLIAGNRKCFISADGGIWNEYDIIDDFSCITYNNNKFVAGSNSGTIYTSTNGKNWQKTYECDMRISKIVYTESGILMALGTGDKPFSIYSIDGGNTWDKIEMPQSAWNGIVYNNGKFTACAYDGDIRLAYCFEKDLFSRSPLWHNITLSYKEEWTDIKYAAGVYVLASSSGVILASYDGVRWIKTPSPKGSWNSILRTDYFFMIFSNSEEENGLNAVRSSNGGLTNIMFAEFNEIIENEAVDKAINPKTLKDYLAYKTGKNKSQYPVYSDDLLIECTSLEARQIKITNIGAESFVNDYNDITTGGIYIIEKNLDNAPPDNTGFLLVQSENNNIYQFLSQDYLFVTGYFRQCNNGIWHSWQERLITQNNISGIDLSGNNISISENSAYQLADNILAEENGCIKKISKSDFNKNIDDKISNALDITAGNTIYLQNVYSANEFNALLNLQYPFTTQQLADALIRLGKPLFCMVVGCVKGGSGITDLPGSYSVCRIIVNYRDQNQGYLEVINPYSLNGHISYFSNGKASDWILYRNNDGSIPVSIGGTGLIHGALGKPASVLHLTPEDENGSDYKPGDIIYRHSVKQNDMEQFVPEGGSWLVQRLPFTIDRGFLMEFSNLYITGGGSKLTTDGDFYYMFVLTKIA